MFLILEVTGPNAALLGPAARMVFSVQGGSIGRRAGNDWILPDPHVSGRHARIRSLGGAFFLEDNESANGVRVNGSLLHPGEPYPLKEGDKVFIDPFEIAVRIAPTRPGAEAGPPAAPPSAGLAGPPLTPPGPPPAPKPAAAPGGGSLSDLIGPGVSALEPNPLLDEPPTRPAEPPRPRAEDLIHKEPLQDAFRPSAAIPQDWWKDEPQPAAVPQAAPPPRPPPPAPPPPRAAPQPVRRDFEIETISIPEPLQVPAATPPPAPAPAPAEAAQPPIVSDDLRALLKGAGIESATLDPQVVEQLGEVLRIVIGGLMEVLGERGRIKSEFRLQQTTFKPRENNPLKFSANVEDALHNLLVKRNAAYLGVTDAFEDAFVDLRHHQFAMLAGMRAAYDAMLARFDPEQLAAQADARPGRRILPGLGASGRHWEAYVEYYQEITRDADDCFRRLFGDQFAKAYEDQLQRLRAEKRRQP